MPASGRTPLARLHHTATQLGIVVVDALDDGGPLLDDDTAAFIACGVCIVLNPGLDDGLRADVLAMALALTYAMSPATPDHGGDITAASGFVLISRTRETAPVSALGVLATVIAHEHGHDSASAAFEYTVVDCKLAQHAAKNARWHSERALRPVGPRPTWPAPWRFTPSYRPAMAQTTGSIAAEVMARTALSSVRARRLLAATL
jgi:hypothetical protein